MTREGLAAFPDMPVPAFGTPNRETRMDQLFAFSSANPKHAGWKKVYESVRTALDKGQLQTPYDTVIALETYFRRTTPTTSTSSCPTRTARRCRTGSRTGPPATARCSPARWPSSCGCLGIPARVAEGFTSGTYDQNKRVWRVTDHDAHAWVEVFFPGYGWLPFDPTPSRGLGPVLDLVGPLRPEQDRRRARSADNIGADLNRPASSEPTNQTRHRHGEEIGAGANATLPPPVRHHRSSLLLDVLAVIAGVLALLLLLKQALRLWRLRGDDPRRRAVAYRADLAAYARDQRVDLGDELTHEELGRRLKTPVRRRSRRLDHGRRPARYAPEPHAAVAAQELRGETRRLRREMAKSLSVRERAAGAVSLRSVVRQ